MSETFQKSVSLICWTLIFLSFSSSVKSQQEDYPKKIFSSNLCSRLSGKSYKACLGTFKQVKILAFFIDKENYAYRQRALDSILQINNKLTTDTQDIKTIILIYRNSYPILMNSLFNGRKRSDFKICFVDFESMCIRKIIYSQPVDSYGEQIARLGKLILKELND